MNKNSIIQRLLNPGIIAILRSDTGAKLVDAGKTLFASGITVTEVTMTTPNALNSIREIGRALGEAALVGVGSVLDTETCRSALIAGAQFVVTPVVRPEVIRMCNRYGVPIITGAATPTEALVAQELGSDFVKLFPSDQLGAAYIKAMLAPLPMLQLIPTGGVTPENIGAYFEAGAVAVGVAGGLVSKDILENGDWSKLAKIAGKYIAAAKKARTA